MIDKATAIADIQSLAIETGNVTRSQYRDKGKFSTFELDAVFGNFGEFKRQAGLSLTRGQSQLLNEVAKHASVDNLRKLNIDRVDYGTKFMKPSGKRFQTIMVCSDLHDIEMDAFWRRVFVDSVKRIQPDTICLGGDIFDLPEFGKYPVDPRTWDVVGRIKAVHSFLGELREASPDTEIVMIEGNHEYRLLRHLGEASPGIRAVLSDLHGMTVGSLLGLDKYEVRYMARGDLAAFNKGDINKELAKNYAVFHETLLVDHFPTGINRGLPGYNGHHHKFEARSFYSHLRGPCTWIQLGCGHSRNADYCDADPWNLGFAINHVDTQRQRVAMNYIPVSEFAEVGGVFYHRDSGEQ